MTTDKLSRADYRELHRLLEADYDPHDLRERPGWDDVVLRLALDEVMSKRRTIAPEVWLGRGFPLYERRGLRAVLSFDERLGTPDLLGWTTSVVAQRPGLLMRRYHPDGTPALPQLRPFKLNELDPDDTTEDRGIVTRRKVTHTHAPIRWHLHERTHEVRFDSSARCGRRLPGGGYCGLPGIHRNRETPCRRGDTTTSADRPWIDQHAADGHAAPGVVHDHRVPWSCHLKNVDRMDEHVGVDTLDEHVHRGRAKYLYLPNDPPTIDVHPLAWPLLDAGGPVLYLALEGILKNDALLSAGVPVINAGSVTLWEDYDALEALRPVFARFGTVVIVPDSDWTGDGVGNDDVEHHARAVGDALDRYGARRVVIAAPPAKCGDVCTHPKASTCPRPGRQPLPDSEHKQGVDDYLGPLGIDLSPASRREALDMLTIDRELPTTRPEVGPRGKHETRDRDEALLDYLIRTQSMSGRVQTTYRTVQRALGWREHGTVGDALDRLERDGFLERVTAHDEDEVEADLDDRQPGTVVVLDESLRPRFNGVRRLREVV